MRFLSTLFAVLLLAMTASASPIKSKATACRNGQCSLLPSTTTFSVQHSTITPQASSVSLATNLSESEALAEVNVERQKRGLRPFAHDPALTAGAIAAAKHRAAHLIRGHTSNDMAFLPAGTSASAAGCAALSPSWGFQACAMFDNYQRAGAAKVTGSDGLVYSQLFVAGAATTVSTRTTTKQTVNVKTRRR